MIIIPVAPEPYQTGKRGMAVDPNKDFVFAVQAYLPLGFPIKTVCFIVESKEDSGNLTGDGESLFALAKGFMNAISKSDQISHMPAFEKRTGPIPAIYVY